MDEKTINVLDKGYVRLIKVSGDEIDIVNAARCSFGKEVDVFGEKDIRLIKYLIENKHWSPFRHQHITFEIRVPMMVLRQWQTHLIGSQWMGEYLVDFGRSEMSMRYVTQEPEFYIPEKWRMAPVNKKQGSAGDIPDEQLQWEYTQGMKKMIKDSLAAYDTLIDEGVAVEQARLFLPAYAMYTTWRWTASLQAVINFLELRLDSHAQWEIRQYAKAVLELIKDKFPHTIKYFLGEENV